jgi:4-diphosphocytidyl-2-C-methyl-D-erythritol kinase
VGALRPDGYHAIESLVVFARLRDAVLLTPGEAPGLTLRGPSASASGPAEDNLILAAARKLAALAPGLKSGRFTLIKRLPVAAGLGGGSADAAAALRLLGRANGWAQDDPRLMAAAAATGADVPVCLQPRPRIMRGKGEALSAPLHLPPLWAILANPGVAVATAAVFGAFDRRIPPNTPHKADHAPVEAPDRAEQRPDSAAVIGMLARSGNDLEPAATALAPQIADVLAALNRLPGCRLARMSGSGATCFGLFNSAHDAGLGCRLLRALHPRWWVRATALG